MLTLIAVGILFQIPVARPRRLPAGHHHPEQLGRNRPYAVLLIAVAAMLLPGTDPVTMLISMLPLYTSCSSSRCSSRGFGRPPDEAD